MYFFFSIITMLETSKYLLGGSINKDGHLKDFVFIILSTEGFWVSWGSTFKLIHVDEVTGFGDAIIYESAVLISAHFMGFA